MTYQPNVFIVAGLLSASYVDPTDIVGMQVSNRETNDYTNTHPILLAVSDIGYTMNNYLPNPTSITLTLDNQRGSLGFNRRFSDLLAHRSFVDQDIALYVYRLSLDVTSTEGQPRDTLFSGKIREIAVQESDGVSRVLIYCNSFPLSNRRFAFELDRNIITIPSESVGKYVPIVFGSSVEVAPIRTGSDGDSDVTYVWGSTLWTQFVNDGIQTYYARGRDGKNYRVTNAASITTDLLSHTGATTSTLTASEANEYACKINYTDLSDNYIVTKIYMTFTGSVGNAGIVAGTTHFAIYDRKPSRNRPRAAPIAQGSFDNSTYNTEWQTAADFTADAMLDEPVFLHGTKGYFISFSFRDLGTMVAKVPMFTTTSDLGMKWRTTQHAWGLLISFTSRAPKFKFRGLNLSGANTTPANAAYYDGLGYSTFIVLSPAASTGQEKPDTTKIEWLLEVNGIEDDGGGTLTGSAGTVLEQPNHIIKLLDYQWDGFGTSTWSATNKLDTTFFNATFATSYGSAAPYQRKIGGTSRGQGILSDLLTAICRNSASRLAPNTLGSLSLWAYGYRASAAFDIPQEHIRAIGVKVRAADTVINRVRFQYNRDYIVLATRFVSQNGTVVNFRSEMSSLSVDTINLGTSATTFAKLSTDSQSLFGLRYLFDDKYEMISDSTTANNVAHFLLSRHQYPEMVATFEVPLEPYRTIKNLDIIKFRSAEFPGKFGTSPVARDVTLGGTVIDPKLGEELIKAKTYRAQVEGVTIQNLTGRAPSIRIEARIIHEFSGDHT